MYISYSEINVKLFKKKKNSGETTNTNYGTNRNSGETTNTNYGTNRIFFFFFFFLQFHPFEHLKTLAKRFITIPFILLPLTRGWVIDGLVTKKN